MHFVDTLDICECIWRHAWRLYETRNESRQKKRVCEKTRKQKAQSSEVKLRRKIKQFEIIVNRRPSNKSHSITKVNRMSAKKLKRNQRDLILHLG